MRKQKQPITDRFWSCACQIDFLNVKKERKREERKWKKKKKNKRKRTEKKRNETKNKRRKCFISQSIMHDLHSYKKANFTKLLKHWTTSSDYQSLKHAT